MVKIDFFNGGKMHITENYIHNVLQPPTLLSFKTLFVTPKEMPIHNQLLPVLSIPQLMAITNLHCSYELAYFGNFM